MDAPDSPTRIPGRSEESTAPTSEADSGAGLERVRKVAERMGQGGALARYGVGELLGRGGVGEVHAATDGILRREIALKRIRADRAGEDVARRFLLEAQVTGQLEHPNVVPVYDLGVAPDGMLFFTMKRIRGRSLSELVKSGEAGSLAHRLQVFLKVCDAVGYAHARGVVHRDLKPGNVMVGDHGEVLVVDWGLAKLLEDDPSSLSGRPVTADASEEAELTSDTSVIGTPAYMAPEQALGHPVDERTDVYALGAVLYALLTGQAPFTSGADLLSRVRLGRFPRPRAVDASIARPLEAIVLKAMALVPTERYRAVSELKADVEAWLDGREVSALPRGVVARIGLWAWRNRVVVAPVGATVALATVLLLVATGVYAVLASRSRDRALGAEHAAEVRLAEGEVALGVALADQGRIADAREHLHHARLRLEELGAATMRARVAASFVEHRFPRPVLHWDGVGGARMSPDGRTALISSPGTVRHVSLPDGATLRETARLADHPNGLVPLFAGDVPAVAAWTPGRWEVLAIETGEALATFPSASELTYALFVAIDRAGKELVLAGDGAASRYAIGGEEPRYRLEGAWVEGASEGLRWLWGRPWEEGSTFRAPTALIVWDGVTGEERWRLEYDATWTMDDDGHALRTVDRRLELLEAPDGPVRWSVPAEPGDQARFVARATQVLQVGEHARWIDAASGRIVRELPTHGSLSVTAGGTAASADGRVFLTFTGERVQVFAEARTELVRPLGGSDLTTIDVSADGILAAVADLDGRLFVVEPMTGAVVRSIPPPIAPPGRAGTRDVAFSPDGTRLYAADRSGAIREVDLTTGEVTLAVPTHGDGARIAMAVRPGADGEVAALWEDGTVVVRGPDGGVRTLASGLASVWDLAPLPDRGWYVASSRGEGPAFSVFATGNGAAIAKAPSVNSAHYRLAVSRDGRLALGDQSGRVTVWTIDPAGKVEERRRLETGPEVVMAIAFSPDGRVLATGAYDGRVQLWDVANGTELLSMRIHRERVTDLAFTPDGTRLLTASGEGALGVFHLDLAERLDTLLVPVPLGGSPADRGARLRDLGTASLLRGAPVAAAELFARARETGASVPPLDEARALWATGRREEARAALERARTAGDALPGTLAAWLAAP